MNVVRVHSKARKGNGCADGRLVFGIVKVEVHDEAHFLRYAYT